LCPVIILLMLTPVNNLRYQKYTKLKDQVNNNQILIFNA